MQRRKEVDLNEERIQQTGYDEVEIDLGALFLALWKKLPIIILAGVIGFLLAFMVTKVVMTPKYTSTTKMYVLSKQDAASGLTYNDLQTGTQLTKDYMELVKSRPVVEGVIALLSLPYDYDELTEMIAVDTPEQTRILSISVESEDPQEAKMIADALRETVGVQITRIMDADSVNTVEEGNLPTEPSSPKTMQNLAIGLLLGMFLAIAIIVIIYIKDDTIKTPEDVERYLGTIVLTSIPTTEGSKKSKKVKGLSTKKLKKAMVK